MTATAHFIERVAERIGPEVDGVFLARGIVWAIQNGRTDLVEFVARLSLDGRRLFRLRVPHRGVFYAVVNTDAMRCVTVMAPGLWVRRHDRASIKMEDLDL